MEVINVFVMWDIKKMVTNATVRMHDIFFKYDSENAG